MTKIGMALGNFVGMLYQAGRDTIDTVIKLYYHSWHLYVC